MKLNKFCKNCKHFNFKVSGESKCYGECLNEKVDTYIGFRGDIGDYVKGNDLDEKVKNYREILNILKKYSRVYFNEETFGCIHFEKSNGTK